MLTAHPPQQIICDSLFKADCCFTEKTEANLKPCEDTFVSDMVNVYEQRMKKVPNRGLYNVKQRARKKVPARNVKA